MKAHALPHRPHKIHWSHPPIGLAIIASTLLAVPAHADEISDLRALVEQMRTKMDSMQSRITELEKAASTRPSPFTPAVSAIAPNHGASDGKGAVAPPPMTGDPRYPGYVPLPYSPFLVRFNFKPRIDISSDNHNSGDRYRFVTAKIPLKGTREYGGGEQFNINANGTQIDIDVRAPDSPGALRLHYQNDFFASDTADMRYRLRHAYADYYNFTFGFTYGVFEDPDGWPDTLDYEGTNSVIFARRAVLHYHIPFGENWKLTLGIEKPDIFVDNHFDSTASNHTLAPDAGFRLRWDKPDVGHVQFSTIFRSIGTRGDDVGSQDVFGWGVGLSAGFQLTPRDLLQAWFTYGEGIGGLGNDSGFENTDAAFDRNAQLHALTYFSALGGYTHQWNDDWRSTLSYGYVNVDNTDGQAGDAYHLTHYGSANLVYRINPQFSVGLEGLYGYREVHDGRHGDSYRLLLSFLYSMF